MRTPYPCEREILRTQVYYVTLRIHTHIYKAWTTSCRMTQGYARGRPPGLYQGNCKMHAAKLKISPQGRGNFVRQSPLVKFRDFIIEWTPDFLRWPGCVFSLRAGGKYSRDNNNNLFTQYGTIYSVGVNIFIIEYWVGGPEKNHRSYLAGTTFLLLTHTFNSN